MSHNLTLPGRWSPLLFDGVRKEMNRMVEGLWDGDASESVFAPHVNLAETDKAYEITVDIPGLTAGAFEIEFQDGRLWISGERSQESEEDGKTYHRVERRFGKFRRVIALGQDVDAEQIEAKYAHGVLTVNVGKLAEVQPKKITVQG